MNPLETLLAAMGEPGEYFHLHPQGTGHCKSQRVWKAETREGEVELDEGNSLGKYGQLMTLLVHKMIRLTQKRVCCHPRSSDLPATTPKYDFFHAVLKPEYSATFRNKSPEIHGGNGD